MFKKGNLDHFFIVMKELVVCATESEIQPFVTKADLPSPLTIGTRYTLSRRHDLLICGVGLPISMATLSMSMKQAKTERILLVGFAGSFVKQYQVLDLVEVVQDAFGDLGIDDQGLFKPAHQSLMNWLPAGYPENGFINLDEYYQPQDWQDADLHFDYLPKVTGITVNMSSGSQDRINMMEQIWNPQTESMEGAGLWWLSIQTGIPFRQVRCISNRVETRNLANWRTAGCAERLSGWIKEYISGV